MLKTILQVDDDANDVFLLQHAMRKVGVTNPVQVVNDGQEAINYLRGADKFADRETFPFPALLLMDLQLPYVMGLDVLRWIRTQPSMSLMVIMLTASADDGDITEAYRLGANAFLTKPSEASKLEDMVKAIKAFWLTHNTLPPDPLPDSPRQRMFSLAPSRATPLHAKSLFVPDGLSDGTRNGGVLVAAFLGESSPDHRLSQGPQTQSRPAPALTKRQTEVVQLIADGYTSRRIALRLSVSIKTIEKHRQALMDKLDIHEIATLTRYAVSNGLVRSNLTPTGGAGALPGWRPRETDAGLEANAVNTS